MGTILFLQLPRLDPDVKGPCENAMLAAECLTAALRRSRESKEWAVLPTPSCQDTASDAVLLDALVAANPDVVAATCYLWNIERTLAILGKLKRRLRNVRFFIGGPEIALGHPLLPKDTLFVSARGIIAGTGPFIACIGEGEPCFAETLRFIRTGIWEAPDSKAAPCFALACSGKTGVLETVRGCPMHCAFCCYNIRRPRPAALALREVGRRIRVLRKQGVDEIRVIDPTFNAHPRFIQMLRVIQRANPGRRVSFFVEIRADTLTDEQAEAMRAAGVAEAEVGVQSTDPRVLRLLERPLDFGRIANGIRLLLKHHIRPTVDFMYGLPAQGRDDLERSLGTLAQFGDAVYPQFLPTLLLPGTVLRDRAKALGLRAQSRPPWRVTRTDKLGPRELAAVEREATERLGAFDTPTRRFVGNRLPDLFAPLDGVARPTSRQVFSFIYTDAAFGEIRSAIRAAVRREPHILWQFVLKTDEEIPLDFLELLIADLRKMPGHWLDRLLAPPGTRQLAARRLFIKLPRRATLDRGWIEAAEDLLEENFH
jgi:hypothetical protein